MGKSERRTFTIVDSKGIPQGVLDISMIDKIGEWLGLELLVNAEDEKACKRLQQEALDTVGTEAIGLVMQTALSLVTSVTGSLYVKVESAGSPNIRDDLRQHAKRLRAETAQIRRR